jgi:uncharacterized membrane protein YgcG
MNDAVTRARKQDGGRSAYPSLCNTPAYSTAAAAHLILAGLRHITLLLPIHLEQHQQPGNWLTELACSLAARCNKAAASDAIMAVFENYSDGQQPPCQLSESPAELAEAFGPHFLVWSDTMLLLGVYAGTLKQHGCLPALDGFSSSNSDGGSSSSSGSGRRGGSSSGRGNSSSGSSAAAPGAAANVVTDTDGLMRSALATWQEVQGQVQHVPASHKQLLRLFGVSPQAALWVSAIMNINSGLQILTFNQCLLWNPHLLGSMQRSAREKQPQLQALAAALQPQLQRWSDTPLLALLQPVLLYGAAYAIPVQDPDQWTLDCLFAAGTLIELTKARCSAAAGADISSSRSSSSSSSSSTDDVDDLIEPPLPDTVRDEMLLLILKLLPRVQQLCSSAAVASRSTAASAAAAATLDLYTTLTNQKERMLEASLTRRLLKLLAAAQAVCVPPPLAGGAAVAAEQPAGLPAVWQQQGSGGVFQGSQQLCRT